MPTASGHTKAIRAKKVIGTNVKDPAGKKIGEVEDVMLDKESNNIMFAVVGFGGFLGLAEKYHPIPWSALEFNEDEDAYVVNYTKEQLQGGVAASIDELMRSDGRLFREQTYSYYNEPPLLGSGRVAASTSTIARPQA
jgi:sporulation protein YlmC with PRC-barrel domain